MKSQITIEKGTDSGMFEMGPSNWAGKLYKQYQEVVMDSLPAKTIILTKRGTVGVKASEYPRSIYKLPSRLRICSARGTAIRTL